MPDAGRDPDALVEDALAAAFPDRQIVDSGAAGPSWNDDNHTVGVAFADGERAYCKVAVDDDPSRAARERAVLAYVDANTPVAVPTVLAAATDGDADPAYLATADVDGIIGWRAWRDGDDDHRTAIARAVGRAYASVHACRFETHGRIRGGDADALDVDPVPWPALLADQIRDQRRRAEDGRFDHYYDDVLALVDANRDRLADVPAALCHGDPARPNLFVRPQGETKPGEGEGEAVRVGLLDWELAHVGDPVRELQRAKRQFVETMYDPGTERHERAFYDGYRERAGGLPEGFADRRPLYDAVTYLGTTGFFERWETDFDTPTAELAADTRAEMERRLAAAREH